jgi:hypothetical protein
MAVGGHYARMFTLQARRFAAGYDDVALDDPAVEPTAGAVVGGGE